MCHVRTQKARAGTASALYLIFSAIYLFLSFSLESSLPPLIQEYLEADIESESTQLEDFIYIVVGVLLVFHLAAAVGIIRNKVSCRNLFIYTYISLFVFAPFVGPYIDHGISFTIGSVATIISGAILALLLFTSSAFNKASNPTP